MKIIYKNTNVDGRKPATSAITTGEIAVNYNANNPRIMTEDSNGEIASFLPESNINKRIDDINKEISTMDGSVKENLANIGLIQDWMNTPITIDEIENLMGEV